jgi:tetratricopeptide (TPR) repeat protein
MACTLGPASAPPRIYLSWLLVLKGEVQEGFTTSREADAIEPGTPLIKAGIAYAHFLAHDYDTGAALSDEALASAPDTIVAIYIKGMCRALQGELEEAIDLMERAVEMSQEAPFYLGLLGNLYARRGDATKVQALLAKLHDKASAYAEDETKPYVPPHCFAYVYSGLGDLDTAIAWETKAHRDGASPFNYFSPIIENLHRDPRHMAELRRMGYAL